MPQVYIGVGSNIEPQIHIPAALDELIARGVAVRASSRFYRTAPIGRPEQPDYANGVWSADCELSPYALRRLLREVEERLGRVRSADKYEARTIDLDILLYDDLVTDDEELKLPDPHIGERPFLVQCLTELTPGVRLPNGAPLIAKAWEAGETPLVEYPEITITVCKRLENCT